VAYNQRRKTVTLLSQTNPLPTTSPLLPTRRSITKAAKVGEEAAGDRVIERNDDNRHLFLLGEAADLMISLPHTLLEQKAMNWMRVMDGFYIARHKKIGS